MALEDESTHFCADVELVIATMVVTKTDQRCMATTIVVLVMGHNARVMVWSGCTGECMGVSVGTSCVGFVSPACLKSRAIVDCRDKCTPL
jgi:hypothetical protein